MTQKLPDRLTKLLTTLSGQGTLPNHTCNKIYSKRYGKELSTEQAIILNKFMGSQGSDKENELFQRKQRKT